VRPTGKPPLGSRVNYAHPLARGLARTYLLNENAASAVVNPLERQSLTNTVESAPFANGRGITFDGVDDMIRWDEGSGNVGTSGLTLVLRVSWTTTTANPTFVGEGNSGSNNPIFGIGQLAAGQVFFQIRNAGATSLIISSPASTYNDNQSHTLVGVYNPTANTQELFIDGFLVASGTPPSLSATTFDRRALGGLRRTTSVGFAACHIECVLAYNWALTQAEAMALHLDPYAMVRLQRRLIRAAAAATGSKPWLFRRHTHTIGAGFTRGGL
jgi:hypothetical protein